jgi:uncharacterized protein with HEPN domain
MATDAISRAQHIKTAIAVIRAGLAGQTLETLQLDALRWSGFERQLEIISEASRRLPPEWKSQYGPNLDWGGMAALGNLLRHSYHHANATVLWSIYMRDLDPLEAAIDRMLA